ncbi:hypothetical protein [Brevundimonas sp. CEF1]|uniref:hypothetical protein n=1 Tax=Brevundimonas sp. CEF1 TaxID=3442642 RepID=UPI003F5174FA
MAKARPKRGPLSICRSGSLISQVVLKHRSSEATLEVRTLAGEVLLSHELLQAPASHQLLGDGRSVLLAVLAPSDDDADADYALYRLDMEAGEQRLVGRASDHQVAVAEDRLACFRRSCLTVKTLEGSDIFSIPMPEDDGHRALAFLPDGRLAVSARAAANGAPVDVVILNGETGAIEVRCESQAASVYDRFAPGVFAVDPRGEFLVLAGYYSGLVIFDLASGANVAARFAPHPLDLAEGHVATHDHHHYASVAFDEGGRFMAATYRPGWVSLWTRNGEIVLREAPFVNPKGERLIAFDDSDLVYFDSMGDVARFALPPG